MGIVRRGSQYFQLRVNSRNLLTEMVVAGLQKKCVYTNFGGCGFLGEDTFRIALILLSNPAVRAVLLLPTTPCRFTLRGQNLDSYVKSSKLRYSCSDYVSYADMPLEKDVPHQV